MTADLLLSRLNGVKRTGPERWLAQCPAHDDRNASLSIGEGDDGRTLVHCFAGCSVYEIVGAVGLEVHDLFPPRPTEHRQAGERRPFPALDVLRAVESEATLVAVAAMSVAKGQVLTEEDLDRLVIAARRISDATEIANGTR